MARRSNWEVEGGSIDGGDLKGMRVHDAGLSHGSRPFGMYISDSKLIEIGRAIVAGRPMEEIAEQHGVSKRTISRFCRKAGLPVHPRTRNPRGRPKRQLGLDFEAPLPALVGRQLVFDWIPRQRELF